jgi:hypothetical protein
MRPAAQRPTACLLLLQLLGTLIHAILPALQLLLSQLLLLLHDAVIQR